MAGLQTMIQAIFLDFDGIIVESVDIKTEAFRQLFSRYPDNVDEIVKYHLRNNALTRYVKFRHIFTEILHKPYDDKIEEDLDRQLSSIVFERVVSCPSVRGAPEFLQYFSGKIPMFLISATPKQELDMILQLRGLINFFVEICGAPGKKTEQIEKIIDTYHYPREHVVYIGDMIEDYRIARTLKIPFVGRQNTEGFEGIGIDYFPDMAGIMTWIIRKNE